MSRMTDFCDVQCDGEDCGIWVPTGQRTLAEARKYLHSLKRFETDPGTHQRLGGWSTIKGKDYCPDCIEKGKHK